jgi:hypothetical protein
MKFAVCTTVLGLGFFSARAGLIYEPFDYVAGSDLTGQSPNGGITSWQVMGTGTAGADAITVANGSLNGVAGLAPAIGNSITFGGLGLTNRIPIGSDPLNAGTIYYSFAFKVTDLGGLTTTGGFMAGFNNATGNVTNQPTIIGTRVVTKLSGSGFQVGLDKSSGTGASFRLRRQGVQRRGRPATRFSSWGVTLSIQAPLVTTNLAFGSIRIRQRLASAMRQEVS